MATKSVRFSDVNSIGKVYSNPTKFFLEEFCSRGSSLKTYRESLGANAPPKVIKKVSPITGHETKFKPVFLNFLKCEDIQLDINNRKKTACCLMSGVDVVGNRIMIVQTDIRPFCLVSVPEHFHRNTIEFKTQIKQELGFNSPKFEDIKMYDYHGFQLHKTPKLKLVFGSLMSRRMAIKMLTTNGYTVGEDDNDYVPMYLRHNKRIPIDEWLGLPVHTDKFTVPFFRDGIFDKIYHIGSDHDFVSLDRNEFPFKDNMLINAWDIETKKIGQDITVPAPKDDYYISAISTSIGTWHDADPLISVVFTVIGVKPENLNVSGKVPPILVTCRNEQKMLEAYYTLISRFRPEYEHAFNGGNFDYPIMRDRTDFWTGAYIEKFKRGDNVCIDEPITCRDHFMSAYCHTNESLWNEDYETCMHTYRVKMEAGTMKPIHMPCIFGTAFVDSMVLLVKAYPKIEQKSLASFLQRAKLGNKEDMQYVEMHKLTDATEVYDEEGDYIYKNSIPDDIEATYNNFHEKMCRFMYYSYIDSLKLHHLFHKEAFMLSRRALAALGRFPVIDTFYRADGAVLTNMLASAAWDAGRMFSTKYKKDDHSETEESFMGAYVVNPVYGLHIDRPITGIDFSSLYPSLMAAFNLSPDMIVDPDELDTIKAMGYSVLTLEIPYNIVKKGKKKDKNKDSIVSTETCVAHIVQHNGIIDPTTDTHITEKYVKNMKWTYKNSVVMKIDGVEMNNTVNILQGASQMLRDAGYNPDECVYQYELVQIKGRKALPNECMGVNAKLGQELFRLRNLIKKPFAAAKALKEYMAANGLREAPWDPIRNVSVKDAPMHTYEQICEIYEIFNAKQLAIKIMANTIYGKSGEARSFIYALEVAAGITFTGRNMAIKPVIKLVESLGCEVMYGDTDSNYIKCPRKIYDAIIEAYKQLRFEKFGVPHEVSVYEHETTLSEEETNLKVEFLWTPMVVETRKYIEFITEVIADTLCAMNGTRFLTMSYEEVGFPTYLSGKKKYALIAHEKEINFYPDEVFLRGFDFKKRGQTAIAKKIGNEFLKKILHPSFHGNTLELMISTLRDFKLQQSNYQDFVLFKSFKLTKSSANSTNAAGSRGVVKTGNLEVQGIIDYMRERHAALKENDDFIGAELYTPPLIGESFPIVYVDRVRGYDLNGKLETKFKAAELAEPLRVIEHAPESYTVNLSKYLEKMKGFLGRLIIAEKIFDVVVPDRLSDENDDDYYKRLDKARTKAAQKYILDVFKAIKSDTQDLTFNSRYAKKISRVAKDLDITQVLIDLIKTICLGYYGQHHMHNFVCAFSRWIAPIINVTNIPECCAPNGVNSTRKEIADLYEARKKRVDWIIRETIDDIVTTLVGMHIRENDADAFANSIARGSISIHFGAVHLKHEHRHIMNKFVRLMDLIKCTESRNAELTFLMQQKNKPLVAKQVIKDDASTWAESNAMRFSY